MGGRGASSGLGFGKYKEVAKKNGIKNPKIIKPGQIIKF